MLIACFRNACYRSRMPTPQHAFQVKIPRELHARLRAASANHGHPIRFVTIRAIERELLAMGEDSETAQKRPAAKKKTRTG
jgi:hypothetical protein